MNANKFLLAAAGCVLATPLFAQNTLGSDAAFEHQLLAITAAPFVARSAKQMTANDLTDKYEKDIAALLGWYGQAETQGGMSPSAMSNVVVKGLASGAYDGVIFGETHYDAAEHSAAGLIIGNILASGVKVGAFLSEAVGNLSGPATVGVYDPSQFVQAHIWNGLFADQFAPEADVAKALKIADKGILITYTGCAHTSGAMRDLVEGTFKDAPPMAWNGATIEDSFLVRGKHPVIVAMADEAWALQWAEALMEQEATKNVTLDGLRANLSSLLKAWNQTIARFAKKNDIGFTQSPMQQNLYLGIAPEADRHAQATEVLLRVAQEPELKPWLRGRKILSAWAGAMSSCSKAAGCYFGYQAVIYAGPNQALPKCAYGPVKTPQGIQPACFQIVHGGLSGQYGDIFARVIDTASVPVQVARPQVKPLKIKLTY